MNVTSAARTVSRATLDLWFRAVETPLDVAARFTGRGADQTGGQLLETFEGVQAQVEERVGTLLGDDVLVQRAGLRRTKLAEQARAAALQNAAEVERQEADRKLSEQRRRAEQRRDEVADKAAERKQQAAADKAKAKRAADKQAAARKAQAAKAEQAAREVIERRAREERKTALARESQALETATEAIEADKQLEALDAAIEENKESRQTG
ncbi:MAG TPA: hypothetical protein VFA70_01690 [Dehalococcoidia bacterium]|nr:hypothetical protein [Dehalococcoidia bacterium]